MSEGGGSEGGGGWGDVGADFASAEAEAAAMGGWGGAPEGQVSMGQSEAAAEAAAAAGEMGGVGIGLGEIMGETALSSGESTIPEKTVETPVVQEPTADVTRKAEQIAARKKRRRSLLGIEEEGLLAPANIYRRSLLGE